MAGPGPATHDLAQCTTVSRGWCAFAHHDTKGPMPRPKRFVYSRAGPYVSPRRAAADLALNERSFFLSGPPAPALSALLLGQRRKLQERAWPGRLLRFACNDGGMRLCRRHEARPTHEASPTSPVRGEALERNRFFLLPQPTTDSPKQLPYCIGTVNGSAADGTTGHAPPCPGPGRRHDRFTAARTLRRARQAARPDPSTTLRAHRNREETQQCPRQTQAPTPMSEFQIS
jgi:hypothetical protein